MRSASVEDALQNLERAIIEDQRSLAIENVRESYEYVRDVSRVAQESLKDMVAFLSVGKGGNSPRIFVGPKDELAQLSGIYLSLEDLLKDEKEHGDADLGVWLDELERLLKVFGRNPGG